MHRKDHKRKLNTPNKVQCPRQPHWQIKVFLRAKSRLRAPEISLIPQKSMTPSVLLYGNTINEQRHRHR